METLSLTYAVLAVSIAVSFIVGLVTRNYSTVDRLWSVLPPVYVLIWMVDFGDNLHYVLPAGLVILWGIRLTVNFALKGGYRFSLQRGFYEEDYRWGILKQKIPNRLIFELFNLVFISAFQLTLVFGFTLPLYYLGQRDVPMTGGTMAVLAVHGTLLILETLADYQQWRYYQRRRDSEYASNPRVALGFNTFGLWRWCRHPNYLCEMGQWICVYLYLHLAQGGVHWSGIFALVLIGLFAGSTTMAERITASRYDAYRDWQRATPPWIPFLDYPFRRHHREAFFRNISE